MSNLIYRVVFICVMCNATFVNDNVEKVCRELKYESLVLEGGGLKGLAYVGAMNALAKHGYFTNNIWQFRNISGTSIGCLFGFFVALDISPENLEMIAVNTNFTELFTENVQSILEMPMKPVNNSIFNKIRYFCKLLEYVRKAFNIWYNNDAPGISNGYEIIQWLMSNIIKYSPYRHLINMDTTFIDFEDITQHSLTCYVTKISNNTELMELNAKTAAKQKIVNVLYSSMTLPIIFKPLTDNNGNTLVDGGLILNFPIYQQDWNGQTNRKVLGLSLHKPPLNRSIMDSSNSFNYYSNVNQYSRIKTFTYLHKLISVITSLKSYLLYSTDPRNCDRVIYLNSSDIKMIDLHITVSKIKSSINKAYIQTMDFLKRTSNHKCLSNIQLSRPLI